MNGIEGQYARADLEDGRTDDWLLSKPPRGGKEGDILRQHVRAGHLEVAHAETEGRWHSTQDELNALNRATRRRDRAVRRAKVLGELLFDTASAQAAPEGILTIWFLDIGQGDAALIRRWKGSPCCTIGTATRPGCGN